jgi:hypothetical protein
MLHSSVIIYSSVPRNINGLYSSVPKQINVASTNEHRAHIFVPDEYTGGDKF